MVASAFARVLVAVQDGGGPELALRPYLLRAVRDVAAERGGAPVELSEHQQLLGRAFATLPERWQVALWHVDVEGARRADVALLTGLDSAALGPLGFRARQGLGDAIVAEQLRSPHDDACLAVIGQLGAYARDRLTPPEQAAVAEHLAQCPSCPAVLASLTPDTDARRADLVPAVAGVPASAYVAGLAVGNVVTLLWRGPRRTRVAAIAAIAVIAIAVGTAAVASAGDDGLSFRKATSARLALELQPTTAPEPRPPATLPTTVSPTTVPPTTVLVTPVEDTAPSTGTSVAEPPPTTRTTNAPLPATRPTTRTTPRPTTTPRPAPPPVVTTTTVPAFTFAVDFDGTISTTAAAPASWRALPRSALAPGDVPLTATFTMRATNTTQAEAPGLTLQFLIAPPVRWVSANPNEFGCSVAGAVLTCMSNGPVAAGATATLVLGFVNVTAAGFSLTPSIAAPAGATLTGPGVFTFPATDATDALAVLTTRGSAAVIVSPPATPCTDPCDTSVPTSAASGGPVALEVTGSVRAAYLVWWAPGKPPALPRVRISIGNTAADVTTSRVRTAAPAGAYVAIADVTAAERGSGTVSVESSDGSPVRGWALVAVGDDPGGPRRVVRIDTPAILNAAGGLDALAVGGAATYAGEFPAGDLRLVGFGNRDGLEQLVAGQASPVADPFTSDPAVWATGSFGGGSVNVSTTATEPFVLALAVSSSPQP